MATTLSALPLHQPPWIRAAQDVATPTSGGTLRAGIYSDYVSLDPHAAGGGAIALYLDYQQYGGLTRWEADQLEAKPNLAESWEWSEDNRTITFHLRQGAKFHDGREVTSADVQFSWERLIAPETGAGGESARQVRAAEQIEYPDPYTIRVTTTEPMATAPIHFGMINVVPPDWSPDNPVGAGPFALDAWERNRVIRYRAHTDYRDPALPYLDTLEFHPTPDEDVKLLRLQAGELDFIDSAPLGRLSGIMEDPNLTLYAPAEALMYYWIIPNISGVPALQDVRVRQAISWAIDRPLLREVLFDASEIMWARVHAEHWAFSAEAVKYETRDLELAQQLLAEAGYGDGLSLEMMYLTGAGMYQTVAEFVQQNLRDVGIELTLTPAEPGTFHERLEVQGSFEIALTGMNPAAEPDMIYSWPVEGTSRETSGWAELPESQETLDLIAEGRRTIDRGERQRIYRRVHELDMDYLSSWVIDQLLWFHVGSPRIHGYQFFVGTAAPSFRSVWLAD